MLKGAVAGRYAEALYEIAVAGEIVDRVEKELKAVVELLEQNQELKKILYHPRITAEEKKNVLKALLGEKVHDVTINFLCLVVDRQRENYLQGMVDVFSDIADKGRNISHVEVTSAIKLNDGDRKRLVEMLGAVTGKDVRADFFEDPSLIGGIVLRIGDKLIDGSIKTRLQSLNEHLRQIS